nr:unnamed protein product [Digitaria exilis]
MFRITNNKRPRRAAAATSRMRPVPVVSGDVVLQEEETRDWTQLLPDVVRKVAGDLLADDVTEYIRLRAVCKPWRSSTTDPSILNPMFFPRKWLLMVAGEKLHVDKSPERFVNVVTGGELKIHLPNPKEYTHHGNAEGLLILHHSRTDTVCLLNPLTMAFVDLPAMAAVHDADVALRGLPSDVRLDEHSIEAAGVVAEGNIPATVVLSLKSGMHTAIVCAKPGDVVWRAVDTSCADEIECELPAIEGGLSLNGRFFVPTRAGDVLALELRPQPKLTLFVARHGSGGDDGEAHEGGLNERYYLAPSGKDDANAGMIMVRSWGPGYIYFDTFAVDVSNTSVSVHEMDGTDTTVFRPSITVRSSAFPHVEANTAYLEGCMDILFHGDDM